MAALAVLTALLATPAFARTVTIDRFADPALGADVVQEAPELAPILRACLFGAEPTPEKISPRRFARQCVVPYVHGLWLDPKVLYRSKANIAAQAEDKLVLHPAGAPFPIFYPPHLARQVEHELQGHLPAEGVVLKPLPEPLPKPSLDPASLYNNVGLLYLPNAYVVPGETFNEMYGWDSFFIIKGLLASVDHVMRYPTSQVWSPEDQTLYRLSTDPNHAHYYRAFAQELFDTAKGMVDNHIFEIAYYGGFVLNANRTYYLTRSQPPLFTQEALAVLESARLYGFSYKETLAPYLAKSETGFTVPETFEDWARVEVLPAARRYYAYWTEPTAANPRLVEVEHNGQSYSLYLYGTAGVGPAPEVARSTQPQNRALYKDFAEHFAKDAAANPGRLFYNPDQLCNGPEPTGGCGDPTYGLTQAFYAADRAVRASGFDLSGRFGEAGEWAMHYAPISLNTLLLQMAEDIDTLSEIVGEPPPYGAEVLGERRRFLVDFFAHESGYGDRLVGDVPAGRRRFAYPYATQAYLLWSGALRGPGQAAALVETLRTGSVAFLAPAHAARFGIPTSLIHTGKQWDAPFAWAPIQYFTVDGLMAHAFASEAGAAMAQWIAAVQAFFAETGVLIEKYAFDDPTHDPRVTVGYAKTQRGFGWTNAVYLLFVTRLYQPL